MKGKNLLIGLNHISQKYIDEAENETLSKSSVRKYLRRPLLVAAVIALSLMLVGCGVVYVLKMQNMKIGEQEVTYDVFDYDPDNGEAVAYVGKETATQQVLTLTGLKGTSSYQATQEWFEFKKAYDPDYAIANSFGGNYPEYPRAYDAYSPYTQEMVDKIDEIAAKYDLKLLGKMTDIHGGRLFYEEAGIDSLLIPESKAQVDVLSAAIYEGGSMQISLLEMMMPEEEGQWHRKITTSLYVTKKDCFNPFTMEIGDSNAWREWNYTTAGGFDVLMLRSDDIGWIICDRPDATISVRLIGIDVYSDNGYGNITVESLFMSDRQFELVADAFDFSVEPQFQGLVTSFEGVDPENHVQTQNGCTIEVKETVTDGRVAYITLGVSLPESVPLTQEGELVSISSGNFFSDFLSPVSGEKIGGSHSMQEKDDGDGLDNTKDLFIEYITTRENADGEDEPAIDPGSVWMFHWEDLNAKYFDSENAQEETLWRIEGDWQFAITFDEGDFREIELVQEPVTTNVVVAWGLDGSDVYGDATISSFKLRSMSASILCEPGSAELTDYKNEKYVTVVMKDGSEANLQFRSQSTRWQTYLLEEPVDLDEVDHVRLADGTRLEIPK